VELAEYGLHVGLVEILQNVGTEDVIDFAGPKRQGDADSLGDRRRGAS
jgi:hypothetical protein